MIEEKVSVIKAHPLAILPNDFGARSSLQQGNCELILTVCTTASLLQDASITEYGATPSLVLNSRLEIFKCPGVV